MSYYNSPAASFKSFISRVKEGIFFWLGAFAVTFAVAFVIILAGSLTLPSYM